MDWLTRLPVLGPWFARLMRTRAWRCYERLDDVRWARLAAAMTFTSFLALFPLLTVAVAVVAGAFGQDRVHDLESRVKEQVPGIANQLDLQGLVDNAGTVGVVAGAALLFTGINWVGSMRESLRAVWRLPEDPGNFLLAKVRDAGVLIGLGAAGLVTVVASAASTTAIGWTARHLGIAEDGVGGVLLRVLSFAVAVGTDFLLLLYVLSLLPRVHPRRRRLVFAALIGAIGFELLKLLIGGYISGVASKNMYGVFGVPIALLLWINFTAKLLLYCAAWTAVEGRAETAESERAEEAEAARLTTATEDPAADAGGGRFRKRGRPGATRAPGGAGG
ncbi:MULTISPECIES: YihY/virulence factor BrkB family protein [unclassified Streptomyces]|uniref:YihY/virulence factor BrkB family protein n=2 Tax=Streptomyces TaxID=1883 RepID=UPI0010139820|nr:YihY/virulence factor BrkB family protein [Streptomyces sp. GZWMJZ-114]